MSSVTRVPQTRTMNEADLSADDARTTLRHYGRWPLLRDSFVRFRYGDGFSHSRALALQLVLSLIPLGIAFIGLSSTLRTDSIGDVLREVLLRVTPGSTDQVVRQTIEQGEANIGHGEIALFAGLAAAVIALTSSMGQVERGANRIYGIQRDRPTLKKYGRAAVLALSAGLMSLAGFIIFVAGGIIGRVLQRTYGWSDEQFTVWSIVRFPLGALLALSAFTLLLEHSPRRRQPGWSWISIGAGVSLTLWVALTYLLAVYVRTSGSFGSTYGPLTGIIALLIWAQLTSIALFLGISFCAQLEAVRAGVHDPERGDPEAVG
jgi:YihY family inner membrane protein